MTRFIKKSNEDRFWFKLNTELLSNRILKMCNDRIEFRKCCSTVIYDDERVVLIQPDLSEGFAFESEHLEHPSGSGFEAAVFRREDDGPWIFFLNPLYELSRNERILKERAD
jgi:hypothetical protein